MKSILTGTVLTLAMLGAAGAAMADDAMMAHAATTNTMVCRPAKAGETANAMTSAKASLVCKPLDMKPIMAMETHVKAMPNGPIMWQQLLTSLDVDQEH
jgi:hypothetical protein